MFPALQAILGGGTALTEMGRVPSRGFLSLLLPSTRTWGISNECSRETTIPTLWFASRTVMPLEFHLPCPEGLPVIPEARRGVGKGRPRENQSRSNKRGTYHKTDTWRLPCPQEVKKPSASQQEISNHFSDTKATGIRCRSEEEGLQ